MMDLQTKMRIERDEEWDKQLEEFIQKNPPAPEFPAEIIKFPFMMVYYRKKISARNRKYLVAVGLESPCDFSIVSRNLKHKGWPVMAMYFDLPEWMMQTPEQTRYSYYTFLNWDSIERIISSDERKMIPDLKEMFPCPITQIKEKSGQYTLVM